MPRITPSQAVALIETTFPDRSDKLKLSGREIPYLSAIDQMVAEIPQELLTISGQDYGDLISSLASLKYTITQIERAGTGAGVKPPKVRSKMPLVVILDLLKTCPDTNPAPGTTELTFISDREFRDSVRNDISTAYSAFRNSEWKPATVMAGSAIEALLLWAIENSGKIGNIPHPKGEPLENWTLPEYIAGAEKLNLIRRETATSARQAQNFRNLIHPGRVIRLGIGCSRGTSHAALGALDLVIEDISP